MEDLEPGGSEWLLSQHEFLSSLGIEIESKGERRTILSLSYAERFVNPNNGVIHGGILATLIDNAAGTALRTCLSSPSETRYATTNLEVSYLRPATGDLRAVGTVRRVGSSVAVMDVDVESVDPEGEWKEVATGRVTYHVQRPE